MSRSRAVRVSSDIVADGRDEIGSFDADRRQGKLKVGLSEDVVDGKKES